MPDDVAVEKQHLLRLFGAELQLVKPVSIANPDHYVHVARRVAVALNAALSRVEEPLDTCTPHRPAAQQVANGAFRGGAVYCDQFETESNARCHYVTTGPEIWRQCGGQIDAFVMGAGTGGTLAGVARCLKERHADAARSRRSGWRAWLRGLLWRPPAASGGHATGVRVYLVDPPGSALLGAVAHGVAFAPQQGDACHAPRRHRYDTVVEGVGCDRLTANFRAALPLLDGALPCADREAVAMSRLLLRREGLHLGPSAALHCVGAVKAARALGQGHTVVTLLCDGGGRHMSRLWSGAFLATRPGLAEAAEAGEAPDADLLSFVD